MPRNLPLYVHFATEELGTERGTIFAAGVLEGRGKPIADRFNRSLMLVLRLKLLSNNMEHGVTHTSTVRRMRGIFRVGAGKARWMSFGRNSRSTAEPDFSVLLTELVRLEGELHVDVTLEEVPNQGTGSSASAAAAQ